ncbi:hypothetical protein MJC1_02447 [Methylocystis sp. MJC1]|nr:hypothetical protein MJC1_02447 [Methylocystis sp. MJC1]
MRGFCIYAKHLGLILRSERSSRLEGRGRLGGLLTNQRARSPKFILSPSPRARAGRGGRARPSIEKFAPEFIPTLQNRLILPPPRQLAGASSGSAAPAGSVKRGTRPSFRAGVRRRPPGLSFVGRLRGASHAKAGHSFRVRDTRPEYRKGKRRRAGGGACRGPCDALGWPETIRERSSRRLAAVPEGPRSQDDPTPDGKVRANKDRSRTPWFRCVCFLHATGRTGPGRPSFLPSPCVGNGGGGFGAGRLLWRHSWSCIAPIPAPPGLRLKLCQIPSFEKTFLVGLLLTCNRRSTLQTAIRAQAALESLATEGLIHCHSFCLKSLTHAGGSELCSFWPFTRLTCL